MNLVMLQEEITIVEYLNNHKQKKKKNKLKGIKDNIELKKKQLERIIKSANNIIKLYKNYDVIDIKTKQLKKQDEKGMI